MYSNRTCTEHHPSYPGSPFLPSPGASGKGKKRDPGNKVALNIRSRIIVSHLRINSPSFIVECQKNGGLLVLTSTWKKGGKGFSGIPTNWMGVVCIFMAIHYKEIELIS